MQLDDLKKLNKEFAKETKEIADEFHKLFKKWMKKSPRTTIVNAIHLPINILMNIMSNTPHTGMSQVFPELPDMFKRFLLPFITLKSSWGKIPDKKFAEEYQRIYENQFDSFFATEEDKKEFEIWFKGQNKNE